MSDTRKTETLEALRKRFVEKFEGYRPQNAEEIADGIYPDNFSAVAVGRGHADRMLYNPFPEPTRPGERLRFERYNELLSALLYDYSVDPVKRPLVEYYRRRLDGGGSEPWTCSSILADTGLAACWARGGNYRELDANEVAALISELLDRLSPVLYEYGKCEPVAYDQYGYLYEECEP